jgi:DNA repair exonuclease SbcCD ATPase subunit
MTYRERRERRADRLRDWADKREQRAAAVFKAGEPFRGDTAFNTQPGHIPFRARLIAREARAHESLTKAREMASKAAEIDHQADRAIYSDDPDAVEQLEARIATLEAQRARMKAVNVAVRKHGLQRLVQADPPFELTDAEKRELLQLMQLCPYHHADTKGFPSYALQNLGGNITRQRARLEQLRPVAALRARVREVLAAESQSETCWCGCGSAQHHQEISEGD